MLYSREAAPIVQTFIIQTQRMTNIILGNWYCGNNNVI